VIYLGGHTAAGTGIGVAVAGDGGLTLESIVDCPAEPTYLAAAPDRRSLYAGHELDDGLVSAFGVDDRGGLRLIGTRPSGGAQPCHLSAHPSGRYVLSAHWGSGSFAVHPVAEDGGLGPACEVVETAVPHAHMLVTDPAGRWVLGVHLGAGTVTTFDLDLDSGRLRRAGEVRLPAGAGPRHLAFHPDGTSMYVVNELASTLTACGYDPATGRVDPGATVSTLPPEVEMTNYPSAVRVSADGRFVYVANRLHDSVAVLTTAPAPRLVGTYPVGAAFPRDMVFDPGGRTLYVANERSDVVTGFAVDPATGGLRAHGWSLAFHQPTCVLPV
jgi:6-phosphogluconolactonase